MQLKDLDVTRRHRRCESVVVVACLGDPEHVVEEQFVAVRRRQPHLRQAGPAHEHGPQAPEL
jgi:hypothetical protein